MPVSTPSSIQPIQAVVLDRDGTLIPDKHYLSHPDQVELFPGVGQSLAALQAGDTTLYLATNQSGIGRGYFTLQEYNKTHARLEELLAAYGVSFTHAAYCPHSPQENCSCRKPATGMWDTMAARYTLVPEQAVMIGDNVADIHMGNACGMQATLLVLTGKGYSIARTAGLPLPDASCPCVPVSAPGAGQDTAPNRPTHIATDLCAACNWILAHNDTIKSNNK